MTDDEMEKLARAATPGPYVQWVGHPDVALGPATANTRSELAGHRGMLLTIDEDGALDRAEEEANDEDDADELRVEQTHADAAYHAALDPEYVLGLLARVKAAEAKVVERDDFIAIVAAKLDCPAEWHGILETMTERLASAPLADFTVAELEATQAQLLDALMRTQVALRDAPPPNTSWGYGDVAERAAALRAAAREVLDQLPGAEAKLRALVGGGT